MFTSRAEHRLHLRADNADRRLTPLAARCGLVDAARAEAVAALESTVAAIIATVPEALGRKIAGEGLDLDAIETVVPAVVGATARVREQVWITLRYATYLERQQGRIERLQRNRDLPLPADLDLGTCTALSFEGRQKLARHRPRTLGEAEGIPGVTQADIETIWALMQSRLRRADHPAAAGEPDV
jgi:tRNA uridine 5-carboxymethylaminomethyl modification enzyme